MIEVDIEEDDPDRKPTFLAHIFLNVGSAFSDVYFEGLNIPHRLLFPKST